VEVDLDCEENVVLQKMILVKSVIDRTRKWNFPANIFFVIDTKVNMNTGGSICQNGILAGGLLERMLGQDVPNSMKQASKIVQNSERNP
jgi:hypothetical protein